MSFGESPARRAIRENSFEASKAIARHLNEVPQLLKQAGFITGGQWDNIASEYRASAADKANNLLSAVEGQVNSGNDAEKGAQWLEKFVRILANPDVNELATAIKIAQVYGESYHAQVFQLLKKCYIYIYPCSKKCG